MAREIPEVVRAAAGLAATVIDEARKLPETLPGLPVRAIGLAMQQTMKIQQHYAGLVARGDELFTGLRGENEPGLATFDDDLPPEKPATAQRAGYQESAFDRADVPRPVTITEDATRAPEAPVATAPVPEASVSPAPVSEAPVSGAPVAGEPAAATPRSARSRPSAPKASKPKVTKPKGTKPVTSKPPAPDMVAAPGAGTDAPAAADTAARIEDAQQILDTLPAEAPSTDEVLEELAIEELVDAVPAVPDTDPLTSTSTDAGIPSTSTDAGTGRTDGPHPDSSPPLTEPVTGYDSFSIAQLRGHLRGYAATTVESLLDYEQATRAREPYLRMLRNRSERLRTEA